MHAESRHLPLLVIELGDEDDAVDEHVEEGRHLVLDRLAVQLSEKDASLLLGSHQTSFEHIEITSKHVNVILSI
jgi:hypothetical protein